MKLGDLKSFEGFTKTKLNELISYITGSNHNYNYPERFIYHVLKDAWDELKLKEYSTIDFTEFKDIYIECHSSEYQEDDEYIDYEEYDEDYYKKFNKLCTILERVAEISMINKFYNLIYENFINNIKNKNINFKNSIENIYEIISEIIKNQLMFLKNKDNQIYDYFLNNLLLIINNKFYTYKNLEYLLEDLKSNNNILKILEIKINLLKKIIEFKQILKLAGEKND